MSPTEEAIVFDCDGDTLLGVLSKPPTPSGKPAVLIVVGGPQYRIGSHRQFVLLARALATAGFPTLRFDYRGMGDASGHIRTFESVQEDIRTAIDVLMRHAPQSPGVVIWGLCDAASAAMMYVQHDRRVAGLVLLNPWVRDAHTQAVTQMKHYYFKRVFAREFWEKVARCEFDLAGSARSLLGTLTRLVTVNPEAAGSTAPFQERMIQGWQAFQGTSLLILSGNDLTAREFEQYSSARHEWSSRMRKTDVSTVSLPGADHTFSTRAWRGEVERLTAAWLDRTFCCEKPSSDT